MLIDGEIHRVYLVTCGTPDCPVTDTSYAQRKGRAPRDFRIVGWKVRNGRWICPRCTGHNPTHPIR